MQPTQLKPSAEISTGPWPRLPNAWASALFIVAMVALAVYDIVRGHREAVSATVRELDTQARVLAEQTARSVQAVDVVLRHVAEAYRQGGLAGLNRDELSAYLQEQGVGLVPIEGMLIAGPEGTVLGSSYVARDQAVNIVATPIFAHLRDARPAGAVLGSARASVIDGRWQFPLGRRLETLDGTFAGALVARFRVEYFQDFYRDVRLGPGTAITLLHRDGTVAARHPPATSALGQAVPRLAELASSAQAGTPLRARSPIDGVDRFGAVALVPDYPLSVIVARDADAALAAWRSQAIGTAARTLMLGVLAALLLAALLRQLSRLDAARRTAEASQARFAASVAGSDGGIWELDYENEQAYGSPRMRELLGLPPGPDVQPLADYHAEVERQLHPDDVPRRQMALGDHLAGRTPVYEVDYRLRRPDGGWRWIHVHGRVVRDADGRPLRMAGSTIDIDARKRAEEQLRQSEQRYALAMTGSNEAHWVWEVESDAFHASSLLRDLYGIGHDEPLPTRRAFIARIKMVNEDRQRVEAAWANLMAGAYDRMDLEYRATHQRSGEVRWVHTRGQCFRDEQGRPQRVAGATIDVTERKAAEEAVRTSEERLSLVIASSNEGILDWDVVRDRMVISERALHIVGLDPQTPVQTQAQWAELVTPRFHPDDLPRLNEALSDWTGRQADTHDGEYRVRGADGEYRWVRFRGITVRDAGGRAARWAGSLSDIDDRKRAEERRQQLESKLRQAQKLESIGTLAGGIAHDFNNILAAVLGYGEMVQKDLPEGSAARKHIDAAMSAGQRGKSLVERILAFSRSGMGERLPVHVQSVVAEALEAIGASLPPQVRLTQRLAAGNAGVIGDPTQVHQVVMNLCANAAQAMKDGGRLDVTLDLTELDATLAVATSTLPPGAYLRLTITDTGTGIGPDVLGRIFDPFFTTKEVGVGTGLGLSLVHGIVTDLGGGIAVHSEVGHGSTFVVYLPRQVEVASHARAADADVERGDGQTVLLVDDETTLVRLGEETLAELGYEPVGFASSAAALRAFRDDPQRFDVLVSDEAMPGLTGSELAREVRLLRPDLPVLLMTGFVTPALARCAREIGAVDVLAKPLAAADLARALAAALRAPGRDEHAPRDESAPARARSGVATDHR